MVCRGAKINFVPPSKVECWRGCKLNWQKINRRKNSILHAHRGFREKKWKPPKSGQVWGLLYHFNEERSFVKKWADPGKVGRGGKLWEGKNTGETKGRYLLFEEGSCMQSEVRLLPRDYELSSPCNGIKRHLTNGNVYSAFRQKGKGAMSFSNLCSFSIAFSSNSGTFWPSSLASRMATSSDEHKDSRWLVHSLPMMTAVSALSTVSFERSSPLRSAGIHTHSWVASTPPPSWPYLPDNLSLEAVRGKGWVGEDAHWQEEAPGRLQFIKPQVRADGSPKAKQPKSDHQVQVMGPKERTGPRVSRGWSEPQEPCLLPVITRYSTRVAPPYLKDKGQRDPPEVYNFASSSGQ